MNNTSVLIRPINGLSNTILAITYQSMQIAIIKGNMLQSRNRDDNVTNPGDTA